MPARSRPVALYLDTFLSAQLMAHVIDLCRDLAGDLLCLAPPPGSLAVARLEPHLRQLEQAGIAWEMRPIDGAPDAVLAVLAGLPPVAHLVCEGGSRLARYREALPAPLLILLNPEVSALTRKASTTPAVDWLAPRLHRGF